VAIRARLNVHIALDVRADGHLAAVFSGQALRLGQFSAPAIARAQLLRSGLPLSALRADGDSIDIEIDTLVRRLARQGLLEYDFGADHATVRVVIEPQAADYWPATSKLDPAAKVVLSRFAYLRRRGDDLVLESPRAGALFRICDPALAAFLAALVTPQSIKTLRKRDGFPGDALLSLLLDGQILFTPEAERAGGLRLDEGDETLVMWDFHDLVFHTHATEGRQANPLGGTYPFAGLIAPPPALRPRWPGKKIDLRNVVAPEEGLAPVARLLRARHSTRSFDDGAPVTLAELARFLDGSARVLATWTSQIDLDLDGGGPVVEYAARPYPTGGSSYELELYLAIGHCDGLARGFYHYDAGSHALVPIEVRGHDLDTQLMAAAYAMDAPGAPQVLITIAARFARSAWKYSAIAYALVLKDTGALTQTLYLMATDMGLGGCAVGSVNIDLFARMTGLPFHVEGPVGSFALGRPAAEGTPE